MLSAPCFCRRRISSLQFLPHPPRQFHVRSVPAPQNRRAALRKDTFRDAPFRPGLLPPDTVVVKPPPRPDVLSRNNCHSLLLSGRDLSRRSNPVDTPGTIVRSMLSYVQIVCSPTADTPGACVVLHFDNRRYLFGALAEGSQRNFIQQKFAMAKLDQFFLSGPVIWDNAGGILGMILTLADMVQQRFAPDNKVKGNKTKNLGKLPPPSLKFHGAENITQLLATSRRFILRKGVPLLLEEIGHAPAAQYQPGRTPDFEDANVKVWYVSLKPEADNKEPHGRKRSHDDMEAEDRGASLPSATTEKEENLKLLRSVVENMFNSDWALDAMVPTTLHQVQQPATIFVRNEAGEIVNYVGPLPGQTSEPVPDIPVLVRKPWPAAKVQKLPPGTPSNQSLCYIVKAQHRRGKFNVIEAQKLGVAKPDYARLVEGKTVKGKDGIDVTPDMCVAPSIEGRGFAFIDIPDASYIDQFLARPEWSDKEITGTIEIMFWRLGADVVHDPRLQEFMQERESVRHHVFAPGVSPNGLAMKDAATNLIRSHRIDPERFPLPVFTNDPQGEVPQGVNVAQSGAKLQLSPQVVFKEDEIVHPAQTALAIKTMDEEVIKLADEAQVKASDPTFLADIEAAEKDIPNRDTEIITLGTGSAIPSKYRNVSATLVRVPGVGSYLLDCGENTLGQLRRMFGYEKTAEILCDLKVIWISHLHADHHLGMASVIKAWRDATEASAEAAKRSPDQFSSFKQSRLPRLHIVSHSHMTEWVREYAEIEDIGIDRINLVTIMGPRQKETIQTPWVPNPTLASETGLTSIEAVRVDHCLGAMACVFNFPSGLRVAYSGDCRPSRTFAQVAKGATLLIHEATLDDELLSDALAKKHCTMGEALGVARDMHARRVLLTHFSQRYPKIANAYAKTSDGVPDQAVVVGFDLMRVKLGDFRKAELFLPALRRLYEDAPEDDDGIPKLG